MPDRRNKNRKRLPDGRFEPKDEQVAKTPKPWLFQKGRSGNPGGMSAGVRLLRDRIGDLTNDGADLIDWMNQVRLGKVDGMNEARVRFAAGEWLCERYFGRVKQSIDVTGAGQATPEQIAMVVALQLSPHERRSRIAELKSRAVDTAAGADQPDDGAVMNGHRDADGD